MKKTVSTDYIEPSTHLESLTDKQCLLGLQLMCGLGPIGIARLLELYSSPQVAFDRASSKDVPSDFKYEPRDIFGMKITSNLIVQYEKTMAQKGIYYITWDDELYPKSLLEIYNPPICLFYKGNVEVFNQLNVSIAMVGARKCTPYGRSVALTFGEELSRYGVIVVSGGAAGIDSWSHEGSLRGGSPTVAVMGCGLDKVYPRENKKLFEQIVKQGGLLLSEYPIGVEPKGAHFPMRNRIISGIAKGTLVVEARASSGSLITADMAINEGRDVFAVPGNILKDTSEGTHWLIRQGAIVVTRVEDILHEYKWDMAKSTSRKNDSMLRYTEEESRVLELLSIDEPTSLEELVNTTKFEVTKLQVILVNLELSNKIEQIEHHSYVLMN